MAAPRTAAASRHDERRDDLAESALRTPGELGYAHSSLREIARNSAVSHGVAPYYLHDKLQLIVYCVRSDKARCVHRYDAVVRGSSTAADLLDGFSAALRQTLRDGARCTACGYDLRGQSLFEASPRESVTMIDRTLEEMVWRVVGRYPQLSGRPVLVGPAAAYGMLDGLFQQALLGGTAGDEAVLDRPDAQVHDLLPLLPGPLPASPSVAI